MVVTKVFSHSPETSSLRHSCHWHTCPDPPTDPRDEFPQDTARKEGGWYACMSADNRKLRVPPCSTLEVTLLSRSCSGRDPLLVVFTHSRNHGVHRVHNHFHHCHGTDIPTGFEERPGDASVDSEVIKSNRTRGILAGISTRWYPVRQSSS